MSIKVSIIIPSYNSENSLSETLESMQNQKSEIDFEIIIVDSSPTDKVDKLCAKYNKVTLIKLKTKTLPGPARNKGAENASGDLLIFCDSDVKLKNDVVVQAWDFYKEGNKIFGGALTLGEGSSIPVGLLEHYFFNHESQELRPVTDRKNLSSALMLIDKEIFLNNNGFKDIPRMQDTEFTERLINSGNTLKFYPGVIGYQKQITSWKGLNRKVYLCGNNLFFIRYQQNTTSLKKTLLYIGLPAIAFLKISRINLRNLLYANTLGRFKVLLWIPAMYFLGITWMRGFYYGLTHNKGIISDR